MSETQTATLKAPAISELHVSEKLAPLKGKDIFKDDGSPRNGFRGYGDHGAGKGTNEVDDNGYIGKELSPVSKPSPKSPNNNTNNNSSNSSSSKRTLIVSIIVMMISAFTFSCVGIFVKYGTSYGFSYGILLMSHGIFQTISCILHQFISYLSEKFCICCKRNDNSQIINTMRNSNKMYIEINAELSDIDENNSTKYNNSNCCYKILNRWESNPKLIIFIILRGFFGASASLCYFISISILPLGDAITVFSVYPVITALIAWPLLKEKIELPHWIALLITMIGVVLISKPDFLPFFDSDDDDASQNSDNNSNYDDIGYILSLIGSLFASLAFITIKKAGVNATPMILTLSYSIFCFIEGIVICTLIIPNTLTDEFQFWLFNLNEWLICIGIGIVGYIAQWTMNYAAKKAQAGMSSLIRSTDLFYAYIWEITLFDDTPTYITIIGAISILLGISIVSIYKYKKTKKLNMNLTHSQRVSLTHEEFARRYSSQIEAMAAAT